MVASSGSRGGDSLYYNPTPPSLAAPVATSMSPSDVGSVLSAGFNQGQSNWSSIIQQNKRMIEAWQSRIYTSHRSTHVAQGVLSENQNSAPWGANGFMPQHLTQTSESDETDRKSDSNSGTNDGSTNGNDEGQRSRKGKSSKRKAASSSDGTNGSDGTKSGSGGSGEDAAPDDSDAASSHSHRRHKKKRKKREKEKKGKGKKSKEPKKKLVNLFPRKKKTEEHRSRDHMIISLENLKPLFQLPLKQAASNLGICTTALKSVCRKFGLKRWPYNRMPGGPPPRAKAEDVPTAEPDPILTP
eukprot:1879141-Rhodomonas_salina.1